MRPEGAGRKARSGPAAAGRDHDGEDLKMHFPSPKGIMKAGRLRQGGGRGVLLPSNGGRPSVWGANRGSASPPWATVC